MREIRLPRLNSNDSSYVLLEWLEGDAQPVSEGASLALIETSKAVEELLADADGVLHRIGVEGGEYAVGATVGLLFDTAAALDTYLADRAGPGPADPVGAGYVLTDAAGELVRRHGIPPTALAALGRAVVRARDLDALVAAPQPGPTGPDGASPAERQQAAVAATVTRSHREIPPAFTVARVYVDAARRLARRLSEERSLVVGLPEVLVRALALVYPEHPCVYAVRDRSAAGPDIGVTVDVGTGLFIPVLRSVGGMSLDDIADVLMGHRRAAVRRAFRGADLAGAGDVVLSLSHEPDIVLAQPIVFPGHVAMVSLAGVFQELYLDAGGEVGSRHYANVGLAYDHRVVNGREAVEFLRAVKDCVENPDRLDAPLTGAVE